MIEQLLKAQVDSNSSAALEIVEEVAERVLRDVAAENQNAPLGALAKSA